MNSLMEGYSQDFEEILGFNIYTKDLEHYEFGSKCVVNTLNAYSYALTKNDIDFRIALATSDLLIPDGFPIVFAMRVLKKRKIRKIAGMDLFEFLCNSLNNRSGRCFFLGSSINTLAKIEKRLKIDYPNIQSASFSPPFKSSFSKEEDEMMVKLINEFSPDVIFVGMTAPKQEKWTLNNKDNIKKGVICSVGAVFDFYAGTVERPSKLWIDLKLEWFIRLINEPRRMWRRYLIYSPVFFKDVLCLRIKKFI